MKVGMTLAELAAEIERQQASKLDFVTSTGKLEMGVETVDEGDGSLVKLYSPAGDFGINKVAHQQLATHLQIPQQYYHRMLAEEPNLLAKNVNTWLHKEPEERMVRTMDKVQRAFLSSRYRPLEYYDLAHAVLPVLAGLEVEVMSSQITETRMYLKVVDKRIKKDIPTGRKLGDGSHIFFDTLSPALIISDSEVGMGALSVETSIYTHLCTNLAVVGQRSLKKYHVGKRLELGDEIYALLSDETRAITDKSIWMQVRDVVKGAFDEARFMAQTDELGKLVETPLQGDPVKVVTFASRKLGITEGEQGNVLRHLIEGGDLTAYGLFNAVTRTAEDLEDYDRATEFERFGGKLIDLTAKDWKEVNDMALAA